MAEAKNTSWQEKAAKELYDAIKLIAESPASDERMKLDYCEVAVNAICEAYSEHAMAALKEDEMTDSHNADIAKPSTDELIAFNGYIRCSAAECDFMINGVPLKFREPPKLTGIVGISTWGPN